MPPSQDHLLWAQAHYDAGQSLVEARQYPWAVVAFYYSALHMLHAGLPVLPDLSPAQQHPESHTGITYGSEGTNHVVRRYLRQLDTPYRSLYDAGLAVRYRGDQPDKAVALEHRRKDVRPIAEWLCPLVHNDDGDCWLTRI